MIRFLLDTDTISLLQRQDEAVQAFLESLPAAKSSLERERGYQLLDFSRVPGLQIETWAEWEGSE
jgi:hypothetical protein